MFITSCFPPVNSERHVENVTTLPKKEEKRIQDVKDSDPYK